MTTIFLKTLGAFYYERMMASTPSDFTEMVRMGVHLEEAIREGRLTKSEGSSNVKKPSYGFVKKKEGETNVVNMVFGCPGEFKIFDMEHMNDDLVQLHATFCHMASQVEHHYGSCRVCCRDSRGCSILSKGIQMLLDNEIVKVSG